MPKATAPILPDVPRSEPSAIETIERAAIRYAGKVYAVAQPGRHHDVIRSMTTAGIAAHGHQGFVTSTGRFVGRYKAMVIADHAGQLRCKRPARPELFSEDIW
jgi:hypothetical protein